MSWTSAQDFRYRIVCLLAHAAYKQGQRKNRTHRETAIAGIPLPRTLGSWSSEEHPSSAGRNITTAEIPLHPATQRTRSLWCCNTPRSSLLGSLLDGARRYCLYCAVGRACRLPTREAWSCRIRGITLSIQSYCRYPSGVEQAGRH